MYNRQFPNYYPTNHYPYVVPEQQPYPQTYYPHGRTSAEGQQEEQRERQQDFGGNPYVVDIEEAAERNRAFRRAIWTGRHLQVTLMSIPQGEDVGLEIHRTTDQFLRIEEGEALVQIGDRPDWLPFQRRVEEDDAIMVPAGKWHNIQNTGRRPLKLYAIYAPPEHPEGTVEWTK